MFDLNWFDGHGKKKNKNVKRLQKDKQLNAGHLRQKKFKKL